VWIVCGHSGKGSDCLGSGPSEREVQEIPKGLVRSSAIKTTFTMVKHLSQCLDGAVNFKSPKGMRSYCLMGTEILFVHSVVRWHVLCPLYFTTPKCHQPIKVQIIIITPESLLVALLAQPENTNLLFVPIILPFLEFYINEIIL
jgi:hypothetical protein